MYKPKKTERQPSEQVGGVIFSYARTRKTEAKARLREFAKSPLQWLQANQPIRKAVLLEALDLFPRPWVEVKHEHEIQKWSRRGVKR